MTKEELQQIIDEFDEESLKQQAIFGILQNRQHPEEGYVRANKEGLEVFALELLKAARDTDEKLAANQNLIVLSENDEKWLDEDSSTFIQHIELLAGKQKVVNVSETKSTLAGKILPYGCGVVLILVVVAIVTGFITMFKWIF